MAKKASVSAKKEAAIRADEDSRIASAARLKGVANHGSGFVNFIREQGVVGLAVGLAIGTAAGASVKTIVDNFVSPVVALITQGVDLSNIKTVIELGNGKAVFGWGEIISSLITLIATALVIYWVVHVAKLDRADKKKD